MAACVRCARAQQTLALGTGRCPAVGGIRLRRHPASRHFALCYYWKPHFMTTVTSLDCKFGTRINRELQTAKQVLDALPPAVSIYGGSRVPEHDPYYAHAFELARSISAAGIPVISGGGPGIMEAANKGARQGEKGASIGLTIRLPKESPNLHHDISIEFEHFASRKITFCRNSRAFVCMPGGMGTLDELFEVLTLVQTGKMAEIPVILFGVEFWSGLLDWLRHTVLARGLIPAIDLDRRIRLVDTVDEAMHIIESAEALSKDSLYPEVERVRKLA